MRNIVGLDLDSVLCNTEFALDKYLREELGVFLDWENEVDQYKIELLPRISPDQKKKLEDLIHSGTLFKDLLPYNYSEHATKKLKNEVSFKLSFTSVIFSPNSRMSASSPSMPSLEKKLLSATPKPRSFSETSLVCAASEPISSRPP